MDTPATLNMPSHFSHQQFSERKFLIQRANRLIEKYNLPVPRFLSTRFINFDFWAHIFIRVFGIKCNTLLRTPKERAETIQTCINVLSSLIGDKLDHIKAENLLHYDITAMNNLIQIVELWNESIQFKNDVNVDYDRIVSNPYDESLNITTNFDTERDVELSSEIGNDDRNYHNQLNKSQELATQLCKALKNQTLALEIEKKIKLYFGDVTVTKSCSHVSNIRSSRQSIVRTRAIQPNKATFDYNFQNDIQRNKMFSVDLEKLFPEISGKIIEKIKEQELNLLMSQRNIRIWQENLSINRIMRSLNGVINQQRQRIELLNKEVIKEDAVTRAKNNRIREITLKHSEQEVRTQKALLQKGINTFYNESTAAYLNARSHLEQILITEFKKVDARKRQQINEIRKYLQNHFETETEKIRSLLENFDSM